MVGERQHIHKGIEHNNGVLRKHSVFRQHKNLHAKIYHNKEVIAYNKKCMPKASINVPIDCEGYAFINLRELKIKGCKVELERVVIEKSKRIRKVIIIKFDKSIGV